VDLNLMHCKPSLRLLGNTLHQPLHHNSVYLFPSLLPIGIPTDRPPFQWTKSLLEGIRKSFVRYRPAPGIAISEQRSKSQCQNRGLPIRMHMSSFCPLTFDPDPEWGWDEMENLRTRKMMEVLCFWTFGSPGSWTSGIRIFNGR